MSNLIFVRKPRATTSAKTITFASGSTSSANGTVYTFSGLSIGTASADRIVAVGAVGQSAGSTTISSVTVAGNSCTEALQVASSTLPTGIFYVALASGTTGDVVVTFSGTNARAGVVVYAITGATGAPLATNSDTTFASSAVSVSHDFDANSVGIAVAQVTGGSTPTTTWAGLTEGYDANMEASANCISGAGLAFAAAAPGTTVSATFSSGTDGRLVLAEW